MQVICKKQSGLMITEVIIVLVLIAILALLITPAYFNQITQYRLTLAAEALYDDLLLAHSYAIKQASAVNFVFTTGSGWCYGYTTQSTCDCNSGTHCEQAHTTSTDFTNISLSITGFSGNKTSFDATRGIPESTGTITLTSSATGAAITVSINALGQPSICSSTVGGYPPC